MVARITNNWRIKLLALFLTASTWSVVVYAADPPDSRLLSGIQVEHGPPPVGLVLLREPEAVPIQIVGLRSGLLAFKKEDLHVSVDISSAHKGTNHLPLKIDLSDHDVSIRSAPSSIEVDLDQVATVTKQVTVKKNGKPATCCIDLAPVTTPDSVSITGPASVVSTAVVLTTVDITGLQADAQFKNQTLSFVSPDQKPLPQVTANPPSVSVTVPITNVKERLNLPINVVLAGQPAAGYHVTGIDVTPLVVLVEGDPTALNGVTQVDTETIDISSTTGDIVKTVNLRPKAGLNVITHGPFSIHIHISPDNRVQPSPSPQSSPGPSPRPSP